MKVKGRGSYLKGFFKGIDWENLRKEKAPFIPAFVNDYDTSNFQRKRHYDEKEFQEPFFSKEMDQGHNIVKNQKNLRFFGN